MGLAIETWSGRPLRWWNSVRVSQRPLFLQPPQRKGRNTRGILSSFLSFPFRPQHHRLDFSEIQHLDKDSPLTRNLNVLRSTENMLLFYWEVSNGSRRTLLERHRPWVYSKNAAHSAPWCMCVRLIQSGIPSSPLPGDVVSSFWKILPSWGQWMFLTQWVVCLKLGKPKTWIPF